MERKEKEEVKEAAHHKKMTGETDFLGGFFRKKEVIAPFHSSICCAIVEMERARDIS